MAISAWFIFVTFVNNYLKPLIYLKINPKIDVIFTLKLYHVRVKD